ncbi:hypothetical protein J1605_009122 [Eschrichtius robustus]|uniref:Sortilin N-terminal domain-containing protein n=1 Tax=Eschrichtius robustus TaxID=9764 RepID=A0AB34GW72_ESCRO|nr:hypothetical protein J1605_009122 [Eschrichtius robustus]
MEGFFLLRPQNDQYPKGHSAAWPVAEHGEIGGEGPGQPAALEEGALLAVCLAGAKGWDGGGAREEAHPRLPEDLQVISTDESQVFVAVQEWYQTDTYNLYQSDPRGVRYSLVLGDVRSSRQAEESVVIDILEVRGVKGVFLANQKVDGKVVTLITYSKGRDWDYLRPPSTDMNGKPTNCKPSLGLGSVSPSPPDLTD